MKNCLPVASYNSKSALYWYQVKQVGVGSACSIKFYIRLAVRQVVFTDVLIVGRLHVETDAASDWLLIKRHGSYKINRIA
jgi:hypothetical protein